MERQIRYIVIHTDTIRRKYSGNYFHFFLNADGYILQFRPIIDILKHSGSKSLDAKSISFCVQVCKSGFFTSAQAKRFRYAVAKLCKDFFIPYSGILPPRVPDKTEAGSIWEHIDFLKSSQPLALYKKDSKVYLLIRGIKHEVRGKLREMLLPFAAEEKILDTFKSGAEISFTRKNERDHSIHRHPRILPGGRTNVKKAYGGDFVCREEKDSD